MRIQAPVLFYFFAHYTENHQLNTHKFTTLLSRANTVFSERVVFDLEEAKRIEENYNHCIQKSSLSDCLYDGQFLTQTLLRKLLGSEKKLVLENYVQSKEELSPYMNTLDRCLPTAFAELPDLEKNLAHSISIIQKEEDQREDQTARIISQLPGTTLVLFGSYHTRLAELVGQEREVEVHYPYPNYPQPFFLELIHQFRTTGKIPPDLSIRAATEWFVDASLTEHYKRWTKNEIAVLAHYYAQTLTPGQILDLRELYLQNEKAVETKYLEASISLERARRLHLKHSAFRKLCEKENIPLPEDLPKTLLEGATDLQR